MSNPFPYITPPQIDAELKDASDHELERLASEEVPSTIGWSGLSDSERRSLRDRNELARCRRLASEAAQQQEAARVRAEARSDRNRRA